MHRQEWTYPEVPACGRCAHTAEMHIHCSPLACALCALSPLAHAMGIGCSLYTPRTVPYAGARCSVVGCACAGYQADPRESTGPDGTAVQDVLGGGARQ
jgi:hypothetical protein